MEVRQTTPQPTALWLVAMILVVAALHWLNVLAVPIAFALFLMALVWPLQHRLQARLPRGLVLVLSVLLLLLPAIGILVAIGYGISLITEGLTPYAPRMQEAYRALGLWLEQHGVALGPALADQFAPGWVFGFLQRAAAGFNAVAEFLTLTLIFLTLGLLEVVDIRRRLPHALGEETATRLTAALGEVASKFRRYMLVRSGISFLTGLLTWLFALLVGLDLALVWGGLAFALNYIPFIGSIIAVAPPVLFAVVQFDSWQMPVLVLAGMTIIQFSIGNFLDPRIEGRALAISPFVVVASIFFWGLVWGIPGAFIGVPLTIALVTVCSGFHETCWLSRLLTPQASIQETDAADEK